MKPVAIFFFGLLLGTAAWAFPPETSALIENAVLWKAPHDGTTPAPTALAKLVEEPGLFTQEGNFYKPNQELRAFGHKVVYVGLLGIDLYPGPNVTVEGRAEEVRKAIEQAYSIKLKKVEGGFDAELQKNVHLLITPHPNNRKQTMVIGAYLGE
jgi:hypothetical protein